MTERVVRRAVASDLDAAAVVLGRAFADYPWTRWCVDSRDHVARITDLQRLSLAVIGLPFGDVWVVEQRESARDQAAIVGVAVWSDSRTAVDRSVFTELADRSRPLHGDRLDAAIAAETGGTPRPSSPHRFLETMGTDPAHWRTGLGSAVLVPGLEIADREGLICGLETSTDSNVAFYESLGFGVVDHRVVPGGGPDVWAMHRPPRSVTN